MSDALWDVVVIGAGPAGAMAARAVARRSASVLLVDQSPFPRWKVCGCCFNGAALDMLEAVGLGELPARCGAQPLRAMRLSAGHRQATIALPRSVVLSRETFDAALVDAAVREGAQFAPMTRATLGPLEPDARHVTLARGNDRVDVRARVVLVATGLHAQILNVEPAFTGSVERHSRVGLGAVLDDAPAWYRAGVIFMAWGPRGYVGLVRLEDGRLDVAAACDPVFVRARHGPVGAVRHLLEAAGWPVPTTLAHAAWRGTPGLTRRSLTVGTTRLFLIGDAAGYVEPFTGEGIAWALASGMAVVPFALQAARRWEPSLAMQWTTRYHRLIGKRQRMCRIVTGALRQVRVTQVAVRLLARVPILASPIVRLLNAPMKAAPAS